MVKDSLLRLHRNLTNLQTELQTHLYDALQETEIFKHDNEQHTSQFSTSIANLVVEFERVKTSIFEGIVDLSSHFKESFVESHDIASARTEDVLEKIRQVQVETGRQHASTEHLGGEIGRLKTGVFETFDQFKQLEISRF